MAVEMFSWPSLHERMCRTWGSNLGPLACQANSPPIELPRPVRLNSDNEFFVRRDIGMSVSEKTETVSMFSKCFLSMLNEPPHDKTNKMACAPSEDSDQPGHPPSLIRIFAVAWRKRGSLATNRAHSQNSDQTGPSWVHSHFVGFNMRWPKCW